MDDFEIDRELNADGYDPNAACPEYFHADLQRAFRLGYDKGKEHAEADFDTWRGDQR
jgi:hypothetical protein